MSPWLDNPVIQSAAIPFVVALAVALTLRRAGGLWAGLGFAAALGASIYFTIGFQLLPLTSIRKILVAGAAAVLVGILLESVLRDRRIRLWLPTIAGAAAALWIIWPVIARSHGAELAWLIVPVAGYVAWLMAGIETLDSRPARTVVAVLMLAIGTGVSALLGASALMGQLGGAVGAALGAYVAAFLLRGEFTPGRALTIPATLLCALIGVAAVVYARLPWYSLVPLALIPLSARLPLASERKRIATITLASLYTLPPALAAIFITWRVAGAPPI